MCNPSFVFFGVPEFSRIILDELKKKNFLPKLVVTTPDKPIGRKQILTPSPVKVWAQENHVPLLEVSHPREAIETLREGDWDVFIVASYGYILSQELLDIPRYGVLNVHTSLLPRYRGASPIESAILHGESETGSTIMRMVQKMDAGPILAQEKFPLDAQITKPELFDALAHQGGALLARILCDVIAGDITPREQEEEGVSYCHKIRKADGDITHDDDLTRWRKYRAYYGWPGVFFFDTQGKRIKVTKARFEDGRFVIERVIPEGKKEMEYKQ